MAACCVVGMRLPEPLPQPDEASKGAGAGRGDGLTAAGFSTAGRDSGAGCEASPAEVDGPARAAARACWLAWASNQRARRRWRGRRAQNAAASKAKNTSPAASV